MLLLILHYAVALYDLGEVPPQYSVPAFVASVVEGVNPYDTAHQIYHGSDWTRDPEACGDGGDTCGAYKLSAIWPRKLGLDRHCRTHWWRGHVVAARWVRYTKGSHAKCNPEKCTHWVAHASSSRRGRNSPAVRRRVKCKSAFARAARHWPLAPESRAIVRRCGI